MHDWEFRTAELNSHQKILVEQLAMMRECRRSMSPPPEFHYCGREDFLLQHGEWFSAQSWRHSGFEGVPKTCYSHSYMLCKDHRNLRYVEGSAIYSAFPLAIDHAWTTDVIGNLIDGTWLNNGLAYLGVRFPLRSVAHSLKIGDSMLDCPRSRFNLYRKPWKKKSGVFS